MHTLTTHHITQLKTPQIARSSQALQEDYPGGIVWEELDVTHAIAALKDVRAAVLDAHKKETQCSDFIQDACTSCTITCDLSVQGLSLSFFPSASHTHLRFIERSAIRPAWQGMFDAHAQDGRFVAVFVDPMEFHFRTFEHILPMDHMFDVKRHQCKLSAARELCDGAMMLKAKLNAPLRQALFDIDRAELYLAPLNKGSRGGKRLIFHAAKLAKLLTQAVRKALPKPMLQGFSHINPVFRCNRFAPNDTAFASHVDTPYSDPARRHISRYTVILYMTAGTGEPVLRLEETTVDEVDAWTCVIFEQKMEHSSTPFLDGPKIFLRTELIFEAPDIAHSPQLASLFAQATGLTTESANHPGLARAVHALYDRAAQAHWHGANAPHKEVFVRKSFRDIHMISNGHSTWLRGDQLSLKACAALVILDYFNCKLGDVAFKKACDTQACPETFTRDDVQTWLLEQPLIPQDQIITHFPTEVLFPTASEPDADIDFPEELYELNDGVIRGLEESDYARCPPISKAYISQQKLAKQALLGSPVLIMGDEVFLDESRITLHGNQIFVGSHAELAPLNFAASTSYAHSVEDYVVTKVDINAPYLLLPPLLYSRDASSGIVHIMCDLFQNAWMVTHKSQRARIPELTWPW